MIENVVFDLGNVLFKFNGMEVVKIFNNGKENKHLQDVIFNAWPRRDSGELSDPQFLKLIKPELSKEEYIVAKKIICGWIDILEYDQKVLDTIKKLKEKNIKIYAISNIPLDFAKRFKTIDEFKDFDGAIFSSKELLMKPDIRIFELAIKKFKINPNNSIYIDDKQENVNSACLCGFKGIVFENNIDEIYESIQKYEK